MIIRRSRWTFGVATIAASMAATLQVAQASPAPSTAMSHRVGATTPKATASSGPAPLEYQTLNAPIESAPVVYLVFWGPQWQVGWSDVSTGSGTIYTSAQAQTYITDFFAYLGSTATKWNGSQSQYCSGVPVGTIDCRHSRTHVASKPVVFGGSWVDTTSPPPPPLVPDRCAVAACLPAATDGIAQGGSLEREEAIRAEAHFLGPGGYDPNANYMIMLPKGTGTPGYGEYCAYHSETVDPNGNDVTFSNIPYVMDLNIDCGTNYVNSDNAYGNGWFDGYSIIAGHEFAEAETDPFPGVESAWLDSNGQETGDKCSWIPPSFFGGTGGVADYNIGPKGGPVFAVQPLWSNLLMGCV